MKRRERSPRKSSDEDDDSDKRRRKHKKKQDRKDDVRTSDTYWNKYADKLGINIENKNEGGSGRKENSDNKSLKSDKSERDDTTVTSARDKYDRRRENSNSKSSNGDKDDGTIDKKDKDEPATKEPVKRKNTDMLGTRTGGAYIPPAKLRLMQEQIKDKNSASYQRMAWEALKKSIHELINKINVSNLAAIVKEMFGENIQRGRGLLCRSVMQAQAASPTFTHVYACLMAIINTKFPNIGELLLKRLIIQFRRGFKRNDKSLCLSATRFLAHLFNQQVTHEIIVLEILTLLLENPTEDSVEVSISLLKESGQKLAEVSKKGMFAIVTRLRHVMQEADLSKRVQYMIEVMFQIVKDGFKDYPSVIPDLDLIEEDDQYCHLINLEEAENPEDLLNVFQLDTNYEENEAKYSELKKEILDAEVSDVSGESGDDDDDSDEDDEEEEETEEKKDAILDNTQTNLLTFRRTVYLTINSSLDFQEAAHKLLKMEIKPGLEIELCYMLLDCCAQQRTYEKFFGLLAQRFCEVNNAYVEPFTEVFRVTYDTVHRLDTNKLRNVSKFFSHLLSSDAIPWEVLAHIKLNEEETNSSSRIMIKYMFLELSEYMGLVKLNERLKDSTLQEHFEGLFPRDHPNKTRFAINFFTSIGLGGLTDELREHLKKQPKPTAVVTPFIVKDQEEGEAAAVKDASSSSSDDSSSSSSSSSSSDSGSSSDDSDSSDSSDD